jgi:hypothetical protein
VPPFAPKGIPPDWEQCPDSYWDLLADLDLCDEVPRKRAVVGPGFEIWFYPPGVRALVHDWLVLPGEARDVDELRRKLRQATWTDALNQRRRRPEQG